MKNKKENVKTELKYIFLYKKDVIQEFNTFEYALSDCYFFFLSYLIGNDIDNCTEKELDEIEKNIRAIVELTEIDKSGNESSCLRNIDLNNFKRGKK